MSKPSTTRKSAREQDTPAWPVDRHAEEMVLGHAVENWQSFKGRIGPDLFWEQAHQRIFGAMLQLEEREEPVDKETISRLLVHNGLKDGDIALLAQLEGGFDISTLEPYLRRLENVSALRQAAQHANKIVNTACMTGADIREIEKSAQRLMRVVSERSQREKDEVMIEIPSPWGYEDSMSHLVEGLLIEKAVTMWSGESGDGKSTLVLALAAAVAQGQPFLGRGTVQRPVLYMDRENPIAIIKERLARLGIPDISDRLKIWGSWWRDHYPPGPDAASVLAFVERMKPLVVWDSLIGFANCDENSSFEMRRHTAHYRRLADAGGTCLVIHHRSEKGGESKYRGSTDIRANMDGAWEIARDDNTNAAEALGRMRLTPYKTRNQPDKAIRIEYRNGVFVPLDAPPRAGADILVSLVVCHPGATQKELIALAEKQGLSYHKTLDALEVAILAKRIEVRVGRHNTRRHYLPEAPLETSV